MVEKVKIITCPVQFCDWFFQSEDVERNLDEERKHWAEYHEGHEP